jgi:hypothetical protein
LAGPRRDERGAWWRSLSRAASLAIHHPNRAQLDHVPTSDIGQ